MEEDVFTADKQLLPELSQFFYLPSHILSCIYRRSNGFFDFEECLDDSGHTQSYNTWFRLQVKFAPEHLGSNYVWHDMTFVSRWNPDRCSVLCIGVPNSFQHLLNSTLLSMWSRIPPSEPYSLHVPLIEAIVSMQDSSVWSVRDIVRSIEKDRSRPGRGLDDFISLHEAARYAIHSFESLGVSVDTVEAMQRQILDISRRSGQSTELARASHQIQMHIESQIRMLRNLERRSQSNKDRLQNEIFLAYNMIAQRDSRVMTRLGEAAKVDSGDMRTIAVVTMAFLPPTFLSAIFSMSFFDYTPSQGTEPSRWSVSGKFWIYWAFAIPLTCLTMGTWVWREKRKTR
ncbi:hypothetical protein BCR34DRAFT_529167 [Clohesyomyces aquaticus]|uniref:Cora-like Mg2+ transporter protein-domain-containing protein n=1 Tax=Clohesyomyces aquaticus TaxID=1231657 RepID=A0A1Y2A791_9PLEO|nr:hypothetical protein BCR34DRAFT_529167 [Clohesyomyces aquaticus]